MRRWVIETAINEINEKTPVSANYKLQKTGRKFTHLEIRFKQEGNEKTKKENRDPNTIDWISSSNDKEIKPLTPKASDYFGSMMNNDKGFGMTYGKTGESTPVFASRIKLELQIK